MFFSEKVEVLGLQKDPRYHKYQFPIGKVKCRARYGASYRACVSIPYGKGKVNLCQSGNSERRYVSIPYGKGKEVAMVDIDIVVGLYQFPMGKVKQSAWKKWILHMKGVSIPYGKGKVEKAFDANVAENVSIPYGKGKVNATSTNKRGELLVSIPYGKGKVGGKDD